MASCVSFEDLNEVIKDAKKLKVPFGFKINAFEHIPPGWTIHWKKKRFNLKSSLKFVKNSKNY